MALFSTNAVAIDGPAGSGKSTVSRIAAERLGFLYIDTGAMYRALTLRAMERGVDFSDEAKLVELAGKVDLKLVQSRDKDNTIHVILDGTDVSEKIRDMSVTVNVKHVAKIPGVRKRMVKLQRKMVRSAGGSVMEGRDIGTVVLPRARHKFYIDASFEERTKRRLLELKSKGQPVTPSEVADDLKQRDHTDKTRKVGPLKKAEDAVFIDTTNLSIEEVVSEIIRRVKK